MAGVLAPSGVGGCHRLIEPDGRTAMDSSGTEEAIFDEAIQNYLRAFNAGDYRRVASYWTEDAVTGSVATASNCTALLNHH